VIKDLITEVATKGTYQGAPWLVNQKYIKEFSLKTKLSAEALEKQQKFEEKESKKVFKILRERTNCVFSGRKRRPKKRNKARQSAKS
jgi:hypothetical protein